MKYEELPRAITEAERLEAFLSKYHPKSSMRIKPKKHDSFTEASLKNQTSNKKWNIK